MKDIHTFDIDQNEMWLILEAVHSKIYNEKDKLRQERLEHIFVKLENHLKHICGFLDEEEIPNDW